MGHGWGTKLKFRRQGWSIVGAWFGHGAWLGQSRLGQGWGTVELMTFNCLGQAWGMIRARLVHKTEIPVARLGQGFGMVYVSLRLYYVK